MWGREGPGFQQPLHVRLSNAELASAWTQCIIVLAPSFQQPHTAAVLTILAPHPPAVVFHACFVYTGARGAGGAGSPVCGASAVQQGGTGHTPLPSRCVPLATAICSTALTKSG